MPKTRFIQIHSIHDYTASLPNRDNTNQAKRLTYGDTVRSRLSSQSMKRRWRTAQHEFSVHTIPGAEESIRSRNTINRMVMDPIREAESHSEEVLDALQNALNVAVYGKNGTTWEKRQAILLGLPEIDYFHRKANDILLQHPDDPKAVTNAVNQLFSASGERDNFRAMWAATTLPAGITAALFGRMMTSDFMSSIEGSIAVAHAISTHPIESERDYFSVVDDLNVMEDTPGSAHLSNTELTSALFYGYVVVDVPQLVSNLMACHPNEWETTDRGMAAHVVKNLIHLIAEVTTAAKLGSTAPYGKARLLIVEAGSSQPSSYHPAFRDYVPPQIQPTLEALSTEIQKLDDNYGVTAARRFMSVEPETNIPSARKLRVDELADWVFQSVVDGEAS